MVSETYLQELEPLLAEFSSESKLWIYSPNRQLSEKEQNDFVRILSNFSQQWTSHSRSLRGWGGLLCKHFLCLVVDESQTAASGCALDRSVKLLRDLEEQYQIEFFDRWAFCFAQKEGEQPRIVQKSDLPQALASGILSAESLVFDPLVNRLGNLEKEFLKPFGKSWHWQFREG